MWKQMLVTAPEKFGQQVLRCCRVGIRHRCTMNEAVDRVGVAILDGVASAFDASWRVGQIRVEAGVTAYAAGEEVSIAHQLVPDNGRYLRHRFSPKQTNVATPNSLPKRIHVAKEAVSTALQTNSRQRSERPWQTERYSKDEAVALRKNHVGRLKNCVHALPCETQRRWHRIPVSGGGLMPMRHQRFRQHVFRIRPARVI